MTQDQLIRSIEQQIDDLSYLDEELFNQCCDKYYDENDQPITELFTPELLTELENLNRKLDTGFYSPEELKELNDSDLSFEISDVALIKTPQADEYLSLLIQELQRRNVKE